MAESVAVEKILSQEDKKTVLNDHLRQASGTEINSLQQLTDLLRPDISPVGYVKIFLQISHENTGLKRQNQLLQQQNDNLQEKLKQTHQKLKEQDLLLAKLVNPNVPPSHQHTPFGAKPVRSPAVIDQTQSSVSPVKKNRKPGRPVGTKGSNRLLKIPDSVVHLQLDHCSFCSGPLTEADIQTIKIRVIEDIPEPPPREIVEYRTAVYHCPRLGSMT